MSVLTRGCDALGKKLWPEVIDDDSARKAARYGFIASAWLSLVTLVCALLDRLGILGTGISPTSLVIDAALFALIGYGILRMSRFAALSGLLIYVTETILDYSHGGRIHWPAALFILCFVNGVRGTFFNGRMKKRRKVRKIRKPSMPILSS
jgi:hypothetical protein